MTPKKTTYTDNTGEVTEHVDGLPSLPDNQIQILAGTRQGSLLNICNASIVELTIGSGVDVVHCAGNQIKELYIPPHVKTIWVDHDQKITNLDEVISSKTIEVIFIDFSKSGNIMFGTSILELNRMVGKISRILQ